MKKGNLLLNTMLLSVVSVIVTVVVYYLNVWLLASHLRLSPTDALFIEGVVFLILGLLLLLGRGGINRASQQATMLAAAADAVFEGGTVGPREIFRRDSWKPKGFTRLALILIGAGVLMILVYFLNL